MTMQLKLSTKTAQGLSNKFIAAQDKSSVDWEHWWRCWTNQACGNCLNSEQCSWCPYTWACVPNTYTVPFLAPAYEDQMCPHPDEKWELRTSPFGCRVSTFTSFSIVIAALSTVLVGLVTLLVVTFLQRCIRWQKRRARRRTAAQTGTGQGGPRDGERQPLLAQPGAG